jgi:hypothetical protein
MKFKFNPLTDNLDLVNTIEKVVSDPASGNDMDLIYNTTTNQLKIFYDLAWYVIATLTIPDQLLLETGDFVLLETGDYVLLES